MDGPSSSNVTGRRKRTAARVDVDDDDDGLAYSGSTPVRRLRGNRPSQERTVAQDAVMKQINTHVDDIVNKKKVGALNCFEYKSPLEMYGIQQMIDAKASLQEMATVLDSAQTVIAFRVDRLHHDVRMLDQALSQGEQMRDGSDSLKLTVESRKAKKKLAISDGMSGMVDYLESLDDNDYLERLRRDMANLDMPADDEGTAGEPVIDMKANSRDVDLFTQSNICAEDIIKGLVAERFNNFRDHMEQDASRFHVSCEAANDLKDASVDWLKTNPTFQKATKGAIDNTATSFHSLNYYGVHSPSGRTLVLHPRIHDRQEDDRYFTQDVNVSLVNNTRALLGNALAKKPAVLDNYLMLEVKDRPVIGRYKIMSKEVKKSALPLAEASRERDLANLTFAEMNLNRLNSEAAAAAAAAVSADATVLGSDMSMLPGHQGLPLTTGDADTTIATDAPNLNQTLSARGRANNDEYVPPRFEDLALEESLIGRVPMDPMDMDKLTKMLDEKLNVYKISEMIEAKVWKNGLRAEEWGQDCEEELTAETRNVAQAGIEGWIKGTDAWTNYDVVKMYVNRDARAELDETAYNERDSSRNLVPDFGKNFFLMKSEEYMNNYPADRFHDIQMEGEELDVMKMAGEEGEEEEIPLEEIQREIQKINERNERQEYDLIGDNDIDADDFHVEFDDHLAAPADEDDGADMANRHDDGQMADILFAAPLDERDEDEINEHVLQRNFEDIALGADEVPELMTGAAQEQLVGPSAEMREEIRNIGKVDNAHWVPPEIADQEKAAVLQRKKREKKAKGKKATIDEYVHYFRDIPDEEREREGTDAKCHKIADERNTFLSESQIYMKTLGQEHKPHVALDLSTFTTSSLFAKIDSQVPPPIRSLVFQKSFGRVKLERVTNRRTEEEEFYMEDNKGNKDADFLSWLLTFNGFRCMENPDTVPQFSEVHDDEDAPMYNNDENDMHADNFDDDYDRYNPRYAQELAASKMGAENQKKLAQFSSTLYRLQSDMFTRRDPGEYGDSDDEFDDSFDRHAIQSRNLDAAKHKKCLTEILNNDTLSMPCIQYALEQLSLTNQTLRQHSRTIRGEPSTSDKNATSSSPLSSEGAADQTLAAVFSYSPKKVTHGVTDILAALKEAPEYLDTAPTAPDPDQPRKSQYGTANTENRKVKINGVHTLLSLALSMPPKMGERVKPSSIVSFILHVANENNLKIVQDRSKRSWMSDFMILNQADSLPSGLHLGKIGDQPEFWQRTQDPDAIEGTVEEDTPVFAALLPPRPKTSARRGRGRAGPSNVELGSIEEGEEMDSE
ncbi:unnamed protein product [Caenorhabditis sp. 36 PRJEB53466]|nr:unnamed protein product [Caenorhabditis sp. 36 PRJEB53466]